MTESDLTEADLPLIREWYADAIQEIADWGAYASDYFQFKWDLKGVLEEHRSHLAYIDRLLRGERDAE